MLVTPAYAIAFLHILNVWTDCLDNTHAFVAEYHVACPQNQYLV